MRDDERVGSRRGNSWVHGGRVLRLCAGALALGLAAFAGCALTDSGPDIANAATLDVEEDLRNAPCQVVTRDMVSTVFSIPAAEIEQSSMSTLCGYRWEDGRELLDVTVHVSAISDDASQARTLFQQATAKPDQTPGAHGEAIFEDVEGLGDQARSDTRTGEVHVLRGRLYFTLNAYHGPVMPVPARQPLAETVVNAQAQWQSATLDQRRQASTELARASINRHEVR